MNSHHEALNRVRGLVSPAQAAYLFFHELDLCDAVSLKATMTAISQAKKVDACVHLAGLKVPQTFPFLSVLVSPFLNLSPNNAVNLL